MKKSGTIDARAFAVLTIFFMIGTSVLIAPSSLALNAKQDAWIGALIAVVLNAAVALMYIPLAERFSDKTLIQYGEIVLGKWLGKAVGLCLVLFYYLLAALMVGDLGFFLTAQSMSDTPIEILQLLFVLALLYAVYSGFITYTRAAVFFFPLLLALFSLLLLPLIPKFDPDRLLPMLEYGFKPIVKGAVMMSGLQELVVLLMFYPYVRQTKHRGKSLFIGVSIGGLFLVAITFASIGVLSEKLTANRLFPAFTLAKNISIGHFFERVEGVMMLIWVLSIFIKTVLTFHAALLGLAQVMNIEREKPLIVPLGLGLIPLSLACYTSTIYIEHFLEKTWLPMAFVFMVLVPALLLGVSLLRRLRSTPAN